MTEVQYDSARRMKYHPEFHFNHGKPITLEEKAYICRFWDVDGPETVALALGRTGKSLSAKVYLWKKSGDFWRYWEMWEQMEAAE